MALITPAKTLNNPYYFISNNTIFEISFNKNGDGDCAKHKVTYETEDKFLKMGTKYCDKHGDWMVAENDGMYSVKTDKLNEPVCKVTFPHFTVTYVNEDDAATLKVTYWLQNMIQDGDSVENEGIVESPFIMNVHSATEYTDYLTCFKYNFVEEIKRLLTKGYTIDEIKKRVPHYCFETYDYKTQGYTYMGEVEGFDPITDEELEQMAIDAVNENVIAYANSQLKKYCRKVVDGTDLITKENTVNTCKNQLIVATFNVTDTSNPTQIISPGSASEQFESIEIDGVMQENVVDYYQFDTTGEHVVKYALPDGVKEIETGFDGIQNLTKATIIDGMTYFGSAFDTCKGLTNIYIPNSVTSIGDKAFRDCNSLASVTIPDSVTSIGELAFQGCYDLPSITIPDSVTSIGGSAFESCTSLTSVTIPDSVTSIGNGAFCNCNLASVTIGSGITSIDTEAFNPAIVESCTIKATIPPTLGENVFNPQGEDKFYVPAQSLNAYKTASGWSEYAEYIFPIGG